MTQVAFAILHVGFVTKYLSDIIVAAFTTGAAYHIVTSQINILLGLKVERVEIAFVLIGVMNMLFFCFAKHLLCGTLLKMQVCFFATGLYTNIQSHC